MRNKYVGGYRAPRTTQECRENGKRSKWARAKRSACNLPNTYDDLYVHKDKCWKSKRKQQFRHEGRGEKHTVWFEADGWYCQNYKTAHGLIEYLEEQDIPCYVQTIRETWVRKDYVYRKREQVGWEWGTSWHGFTKKNGVRIEMRVPFRMPKYGWVPLAEPYYEEKLFSHTVGYNVSWWTHKNLDLSEFGV